MALCITAFGSQTWLHAFGTDRQRATHKGTQKVALTRLQCNWGLFLTQNLRPALLDEAYLQTDSLFPPLGSYLSDILSVPGAWSLKYQVTDGYTQIFQRRQLTDTVSLCGAGVNQET